MGVVARRLGSFGEPVGVRVGSPRATGEEMDGRTAGGSDTATVVFLLEAITRPHGADVGARPSGDSARCAARRKAR